MKLGTRLQLGYWYLVGLLVVFATSAALSFLSLGRSIGTVLDENSESVRASMTMLDALEQERGALLSWLLGDAGAPAVLETSERSFLGAIAEARDNIAASGEAEAIARIDSGYAEFRVARDRIFGPASEQALLVYQQEALPRFMALKRSVVDLHDLNYRAMMEANQRAQRAARRQAGLHGLLVVIALLSLAFLSQALGRGLLARLAELASVVRAIAAGDTARRTVPGDGDELGVVARQINAMLDKVQQVESELAGRLQQDRQLLVALLRQLPHPAALLSLSGLLVASTLEAGDQEAVETAVAALDGLALLTRGREIERTAGGREIRLRLLEANGERPVGWLATVGPERVGMGP
jgi:methyl-accepting chemotaxis protein